MRLFPLLAILVIGCGRVSFDPLGDGRGPSSGDGGGGSDGGGSNTITFVQAKGDSYGNQMAGSLAWPDPVTAGNLLVVGIDYDNTTATPTISDTLGATWTLTQPSDGFDREYIAYAFAPASGNDTATVLLDLAPDTFYELRVHEYRGVSTAAPVDTTAVNFGDTMPARVSITTHVPHALVFVMTILRSATTGSAGPGFTLRLNYANDVTEDRLVETPQTLDAQTTYPDFSAWTTTAVAFAPG